MPTSKGNNKVDVVEREILRRIDSGQLMPGMVIQQRELAEELDISPTPVREAFRRLEVAGILHSSTRGVQVADRIARDGATSRVLSTLEDVGVDLILERVTPDDLAHLRAHNDRYRTGSPDEAQEAHWQLHLGLFEIAGSTVLTNHVRVLWSLVETSNPARRTREESATQHAAIIAAIAAGDGENAKRLMREHHSHKPALD